MSDKRFTCPDCDRDSRAFDRRDFIKSTAAAGVAVASAGLLGSSPLWADDKEQKPTSETLVTQLYGSLTGEQKKAVCFPFDDPLRQKVDNNWRITKARIDNDFNKDQQQLIRDIFVGLHSEEYAEAVIKQVEHDNGSNGFGKCSIALFGEPGTGKFEFVFTGRHVTRRCDGDSVEGAAFGGPIFYGHAAAGFNEPPDHPGNAYWYQAKRANELFQALEGKQREKALLGRSRGEHGNDTVKLSGKAAGLAGIPVNELTADQKELAEKVMEDVLAPFRTVDRDECMKLIKKNDFDNLHFSFYRNEDVGDDGVWDVWQVEGPAMVWYFRGQPHVHTWVHIRESAKA